jgi:ABC-type sugar transport system substrate-binding protein
MTKTIALFLEHAANPYMQVIRGEAEREARQHGLVVECFFADHRFLQAQQLLSVIRAEANRPLALAVLPLHGDGYSRLARTALAAGVDWICMHRRIEELDVLQREFRGRAVTFVTPNQLEIGHQQGRLARKIAPAGRILYVQGNPTSASAQERLAGFREVVDPRREIVGIVDGNWTAEDALSATERWLKLMSSVERLDAVVAQSDAMALGVLKALCEQGLRANQPELPRIPLIGCDGVAEVGCRLVDEGRLAGTVVLQGVGTQAVRVVVNRLRGQLPPIEILLAPIAYPVLTADTDDALAS